LTIVLSRNDDKGFLWIRVISRDVPLVM
jgi:hypothetical protein